MGGHDGSGDALAARRNSEVSAWLSLVLTTADLLLIFVLQKLAAVLSDREQMRVSQGALLKQVRRCGMLVQNCDGMEKGLPVLCTASRTRTAILTVMCRHAVCQGSPDSLISTSAWPCPGAWAACGV